MGTIIKPVFYFALALFLLEAGSSETLKDGNDVEFADFLQGVMWEYSTWLEDNKLDPSPQTNATMTGTQLGVTLDCELRNHYMSGQSETDLLDLPSSSSNFTEHLIRMARYLKRPLHFYGDFVCTGILSRLYFPIRYDVPFSGQGKFHVISNLSSEVLTMKNVGITQEHTLDLTHSWQEHTFFMSGRTTQLEVSWNETMLNEEYFDDIEKGFDLVYYRYAFVNDEYITFPAGLLLKRYAIEVAQSVDLTVILGEEDLPDPVVPTPTPTTTTSTTTTTTSTTTTTEAPNSSQRTTTGFACVYALIILIHLVHVPTWQTIQLL